MMKPGEEPGFFILGVMRAEKVLEWVCRAWWVLVSRGFLLRLAGPDPASSRRASARRNESPQPKDLGWLDTGSRPV